VVAGKIKLPKLHNMDNSIGKEVFIVNTRRGFTLIELLVVIAIIAVLAAILFPLFTAAKEKAQQSSCLNNMMQLSRGFRMYLDSWNGAYPGAAPADRYMSGTTRYPYEWVDIVTAGVECRVDKGAIFPYVKNTKIYVCPSDSHEKKTHFGLSYSMNNRFDPGWIYQYRGIWRPANESEIKKPTKTVLLIDEANEVIEKGAKYYIVDGNFDISQDRPNYFHCGGANYAFCDGSARWVNYKDRFKLVWNPYTGN
jgi:prepilin-type N-terminal cleavage/methylation domain-containing protein/prepilin-type processing-associated H-X9-DG protein